MSGNVTVEYTKDMQKFEKAYQTALKNADHLIKTKISRAIDIEYLINSAKSSGIFPVASVAAGTVVSTFFPIVDAIEDVICLYENPKDINNWIFLAIDILCFVPMTMVIGRTLKFAMHTVKPAVKNGKNFSQACQEAIKDIAATETIAAIEIAIPKILNEIEKLKKELIKKVNQIFDLFTKLIDEKIDTVGVSGVQNDLQKNSKLQTEANKYKIATSPKDIDLNSTLEYWGIKGKQTGNLASAAIKASPAVLATGQGAQYLWKNYRAQFLAVKPQIANWINSAINGTKDSKGMLSILTILLEFIKKGKTKPKPVQDNKPNTVTQTHPSGQAVRHRDEGKPTGNASNCDCSRNAKTVQNKGKRSITYALGTEIFSHQDFNLPYAELLGFRTYSSYLSQLDDGIIGARWIEMDPEI